MRRFPWTEARRRRRVGRRPGSAAMSHDDTEGLQAAAAGSLLQDMVHDSGMMPWINDLGLNGHVDKAIFLSNSDDADGLQLDADTMALLMHGRGGSAHEDASAGASSSRVKREGGSLDSPVPSKRPARNLDYGEAGVDIESHEHALAIQGMLHLDSDKHGGVSTGGSPAAKARTNAHVNHVHDARGNGAAAHGGSKFLAGVAGVRDAPEEDRPHSPADNEHVPPTPSSSGPRCSGAHAVGKDAASPERPRAWRMRPLLYAPANALAQKKQCVSLCLPACAVCTAFLRTLIAVARHAVVSGSAPPVSLESPVPLSFSERTLIALSADATLPLPPANASALILVSAAGGTRAFDHSV